MKDDFTKSRSSSGENDATLKQKMHNRLREMRGAVSGREFARRCGIISQSLSKYEREDGPLPGAEMLRAMCLASGVSADWVLCLTDERRGFSATPSAPTPTPEQRAAIEEGARMGVELLPMMRDIVRALAGMGATAAKVGEMEQRLAALEAHPLAAARGGASSRSAEA